MEAWLIKKFWVLDNEFPLEYILKKAVKMLELEQ